MFDFLPAEMLGVQTILVLQVFAIVFLGGAVRGFAGFGFSLVSVPLLTLVMAPKDFVPIMFIFGIAGNLQLCLKAWKETDWSSVKWLLAGSLVGMPLGTYVLLVVSSQMMKLLIGFAVLLAVIGLFKKIRFPVRLPWWATTITGSISGLLNTSTSMNGPPVIIYFLAMPSGSRVGRASLITFFLISAVLGLGLNSSAGLVSKEVIPLSVLTFPGQFLGTWIGDKFFDDAADETYRKIALGLLLVIAVLSIGTNAMELITP